ncbi:MAG: ABC transporter permease [Roseburia sp.]|nr:ABC transporter permease [Roseburia sp.]
METRLFWKSVIRRKGNLLFLMILIITASFGFMLRTVEYLAVNREIERISQEYQQIGTLTSADGIVTEGIPFVEESPYVEFVDINRSCIAILSDIYNADLDGTICWDGTLNYGVNINEFMVWGEVESEMETNQPKIKRYVFRVKEGVYGYPEYTEPGMRLILETGAQVPQMEEGKTYLVRVHVDYQLGYYGDGMTVGMWPLEEGVWFLEGEPDEEISDQYINEDAALQERNRHSMLAYATADMSSMPWAQESTKYFYLEEGRWLNRQDQEEGKKVCVVMKRFAEIRGLGVGDTLTMTLQDKQPSFAAYLSVDDDTWETDDKTEMTLEIVGIYGNLYGGVANDPSWISTTTFDTADIYIPDSCMPEHYVEDSDIWLYRFSFVLKDPEDKDVFLAEMVEKLEPLGISVSFLENNWDAFWSSAKGIRQETFYSFMLFTVVLVLVLGTVVFLYTWQRKKETAIARAVGVPAKKTAFCACLPMMAFGMAGILAGGIPGWKYGLAQAEKTLAVVDADSRVELPLFWFVGICLLVWLLLTVNLLIWNLVYARKPVLEILQGGSAGRRKKRISAGVGSKSEESEEPDASKKKENEKPDVFAGRSALRMGKTDVWSGGMGTVAGEKMSIMAALRFMGRHLGRFSLRSMCALLVAAVFTTASCCLKETIRTGEQEVDSLYRSTIVEMDIGKKDTMAYVAGYGGAYIRDRTVRQLLDTGNIVESFLVAGAEGEIGKLDEEERETTIFFGIDDVEQYSSSGIWDSVEIYYRDGYGEDLFGKEYEVNSRRDASLQEPVIILPEVMWLQWNTDLEDEFCVKIAGTVVPVEIGGYYKATSLTVESDSDDVPLLPLSVLKQLQGEYLYYGTAQFTLDSEKNRELEDFREKSTEIIQTPGAGLQELSLLILDGELKQAVEPMEKNIALMKILYPLANAAAFLTAIGLSILFLFQRRREAAILRVLGVGTRSTRLILTLELLIVNAAGLLIGAAGTAILTESGLSAMPFAAGCYFLGCLIGTVSGAVMITRGRPLELLQDKE